MLGTGAVAYSASLFRYRADFYSKSKVCSSSTNWVILRNLHKSPTSRLAAPPAALDMLPNSNFSTWRPEYKKIGEAEPLGVVLCQLKGALRRISPLTKTRNPFRYQDSGLCADQVTARKLWHSDPSLTCEQCPGYFTIKRKRSKKVVNSFEVLPMSYQLPLKITIWFPVRRR